MENLTLIQSEKVEAIHQELREIKKLLLNAGREADQNMWLTKSQARERLHVSLKTLDNYLHKGVIPYSRFAGKIYVKAGDIQAHLERNYITA